MKTAFETFYKTMRSGADKRMIRCGTSERARKIARWAVESEKITERWGDRARETITWIGSEDVLDRWGAETRTIEAARSEAVTAIATLAVECEIDDDLDEGALEWRLASGALARDWLDAGPGLEKWTDTRIRIAELTCAQTPRRLTLGRIEALCSLDETTWKQIGGMPIGLRIAALGELPAKRFEGPPERWIGYLAVKRLETMGIEKKVDPQWMKAQATQWPWPEIPPPLATMALLCSEKPIAKREAWAGAERLERQNTKVTEHVRKEGVEETARMLRNAVESEAQRMVDLIKRSARAWLPTQWTMKTRPQDDTMATRWTQNRDTSGIGKLRRPSVTQCCGRIGWRVPYNNPLAVMAGCHANAVTSVDTAAMIAAQTKSVVMCENGRWNALPGHSAWVKDEEEHEQSGQSKLVQLCANRRGQLMGKRRNALLEVFAEQKHDME